MVYSYQIKYCTLGYYKAQHAAFEPIVMHVHKCDILIENNVGKHVFV